MAMQLMLENLKDPKWTATGILYVMGVLVMIYALMNIVHYFVAKDKAALKTGLLAVLLAVLLLIPHKVYKPTAAVDENVQETTAVETSAATETTAAPQS